MTIPGDTWCCDRTGDVLFGVVTDLLCLVGVVSTPGDVWCCGRTGGVLFGIVIVSDDVLLVLWLYLVMFSPVAVLVTYCLVL